MRNAPIHTAPTRTGLYTSAELNAVLDRMARRAAETSAAAR
ncbi:MAG: hypothetical protein ACOYB2_04255 [Limnohabitans sp.]